MVRDVSFLWRYNLQGNAIMSKVDTGWRPTVSDIVTVGAVLGATVMWFHPPNWQIGIPVVILTAAAVIFTAFRHQSHPLIRGTIGAASVVILILVAWAPIWDSFHRQYPTVNLGWLRPVNDESPSPPPPENAWVSKEEIAAQQKLGRTLLTMRPTDLLAQYVRNNNAGVASYEDSWIKIDYAFDHLKRDPSTTDPVVVRIATQLNPSVFPVFFVAYFPASARAKVLQLGPGDRVNAVCRFNKVEQGYDETIYSIRLYGNNCEFN